MANRLLTPKVYANTMLKLLKNNLVMGKLVTTEFKNEFKKVGSAVYVKRPPQFVVRRGAIAQVQDVTTGEQAVNLDYQFGVDIEFTSLEDTLSVDQLLEDNIMMSKAATLAQEIDSTLMNCVLEFPDWVGTPGNKITTPAMFFLAPERLDDKAVPGNERNGVLSARDYWGVAAGFTGGNLYDNPVNKTALELAQLPVLGNVQPYMTQSVQTLTTGTRTNGSINGSTQEVAYTAVADTYSQTLNVKGVGAGGTVKRGEVFTIAGRYAVNPRTKATMDYLQQFVVLADATADGAGNIALTIANPIIISGAYQTVDSAPLNNDVVTFLGAAGGTFRQNAVFHKSAIALAFAKLTAPKTGEFAYATDPVTGVTVRYWATSDGTNDTHLHRWDVLMGATNIDRRLGVRVSGS